MLLYALITEEGSHKFKMGHFLYKLLNSIRLEWGNNKKMTWICIVPLYSETIFWLVMKIISLILIIS